MYCPKCKTEVDTVVKDIEETYPVKGEDITIISKVRVCACCGEGIWDEALDSKNLLNAFDKYREMHSLLRPERIKEIREKYGLSQTNFARILGFGDKTITRYENGSIADAAQNNLIELVESPRNFLHLLEKNKSKITEIEYHAALDIANEFRCSVKYNPDSLQSNYLYSTNSTVLFSSDQYFGDVKYA